MTIWNIRIIVLFCISTVAIQSLSAQSAFKVEILPQINVSAAINKKWKVFIRLEPRHVFYTDDDFVSEYDRTDASIQFSRKISLEGTLAAGYLIRQKGRDFGHRFSQQYSTVSKFEKLKLGHRFLVDETFFKSLPIAFRLRYRLSTELPLHGQSLDLKEFYLKFSNEQIAFYRKPDFDYEIRTFAGSGYVFTKKFRIEAGLDYRITNIISSLKHSFLIYCGIYLSF